jgi:tyrosine-protein kinase Etk/Wzc
MPLEQVLRKDVVKNMDFIPTGNLPPNPAELLLSERMDALLKVFSENYDIVVIDAPPVLAASDAAIIAARAGTTFLVARSEKSTIGEIQESAKRIAQAGTAITGVLFNGLNTSALRYGYGSKYGRYRYAAYTYETEEKH